MRKAIYTGLIAGAILAIIFTAISYSRIMLPSNSKAANITFLIVILSCVVATLWLAMNRYSRYSKVRWTHLNLISIVAGVTTALIFSTASFVYAQYIQPDYLSDLMKQSKQHWIDNYYSLGSIAGQGEWFWYSTPLSFALNDFKIVFLVLLVLSTCVAFVYYSKNKHKIPDHSDSRNHELIF